MNKSYLLGITLGLGLLALPVTSSAQEATRTIEFSGDVTSYYDSLYSYSVDSYRLEIGVNENALPASSSLTNISFSNGYVVSAALSFYDALGQEIVLPTPLDYNAVLNGYSYVNLATGPGSETFNFSFYGETPNGNGDIYFYLNGGAGSIYSNFAESPTFVAEPQGVSMSMHFYVGGESTYIHDDPRGNVLSILDVVEDSDLDGFADNIDSCPVSLLDETVRLNGWYDSGVTNYVDESGCTVMDHYASCTVEEQEEPSTFSWFQPVYSGPSYCEKQVAYSLVSDGVISYGEARTLRDALYQSYRNERR